jgi:hypothetical protein
MLTDITNNLPRVVADHIAACNAHDRQCLDGDVHAGCDAQRH